MMMSLAVPTFRNLSLPRYAHMNTLESFGVSNFLIDGIVGLRDCKIVVELQWFIWALSMVVPCLEKGRTQQFSKQVASTKTELNSCDLPILSVNKVISFFCDTQIAESGILVDPFVEASRLERVQQ